MDSSFTIYKRRSNYILITTAILIVLIYTAMAIFIPRQIDSPYLEEINVILDSYLLGSHLPDISENFYFSFKFMWCASFILNIFIFIVELYFIATYLGRKGVLIMFHHSNIDLTIKRALQYIVSALFFIALFVFGSDLYAYGNVVTSTVYKAWAHFLYQNYVPSVVFFILVQLFIFLFINLINLMITFIIPTFKLRS